MGWRCRKVFNSGLKISISIEVKLKGHEMYAIYMEKKLSAVLNATGFLGLPIKIDFNKGKFPDIRIF